MARVPETCPNCGADVPPRAKACPECGSDESTGWSEDAYASSLGLPDEEFNYDEFVQHEFDGGARRSAKPEGVRWTWWVVALVLIIAFLLWIL
jgi:hypothetical protein